MKFKIFYNKHLEDNVNQWLEENPMIYIHHVVFNSETEQDYAMLCIFYAITDKYSNIIGAIRGER